MDQNIVPKISVLMPVYNCRQYIEESLQSILCQTYSNYELLLIDDCSTDGTYEYLKNIEDSRINLIRKPQNTGLIASLNLGLEIAKGKYIARMDGDDIAMLNRFEKQIEFMEKHEDIIACGAYIRLFGNAKDEIWTPPTDHEDIIAHHLFFSSIYHPTVFLRSRVIKKLNLKFNEEFKAAEDYEFWVKLAEYGKLANFPEVLLFYRVHSVDKGITNKKLQKQNANRLRECILLEKLFCKISQEKFKIHEALCYWDLEFCRDNYSKVFKWLKYIERCNKSSKFVNELSLRRVTNKYRYWLLNIDGLSRIFKILIKLELKIFNIF